MSEEEIAVFRMDELLAGVVNKLRESMQNSPLIEEIITLLEIFKDSVVSEMKRTPETETMHVINLRDCQTEIVEISAENEALQGIFNEQKLRSKRFLEDATACINYDEELIRNINEISQMEISREIEESVSKMLAAREQRQTRKEILQREIESVKHKLDESIEFNAKTEEKLFDICTKVEQEYTKLLSKYDRDIGELHELLKTLSKDKDVVQVENEIMKEQLIIQRALYMQYKREREIAMMKVFNEKLEVFKRNRSARVIQRTWKAYHERISLKKRRRIKRK